MNHRNEQLTHLSDAQRALLVARLKKAPSLALESAIPKEESIELVQRIRKTTTHETAPLSYSQLRLWLLEQLEPGTSVNNTCRALRLRGPFQLPVLQKALDALLARHETLRTTFSLVAGNPVQIVNAHGVVPLAVVDLSHEPPAEREAQLQRLLHEETRRPFDLTQDLLLRVTVFRLGEVDHVLLVVAHHIVFDDWSRRILFSELAALYTALASRRPLVLKELPVQYADFAVWQRHWLQGEVLQQQLAYWKERLAGPLPVLELPSDRPRPAVPSYRAERQVLEIPQPLTEALKALSRREGVTLFMTLLAAFKVLLHRLTGQTDLLVGSPIAGRDRIETEGLIGCFLNTLVLRTDLSGDPSFQEILGQVRRVTLGAYAHQHLPFEKLLQELQPERHQNRTPFFQVFFNMHNAPGAEAEWPGLAVETLPPPPQGTNYFDLTLYAREQNHGIRLQAAYRTDLFDRPRMAELLQQYQHVLAQVVQHHQQKCSELSLMTSTAQALLPDPTEPLDASWQGAVQTRFSQQARRVPDHLAVVDPQETWTYRELETRSNQLAHALRAQGIQPHDLVALYGHRSAALVWAVLGVLKAGAAFLILDPAYPASRLIACLQVAQPHGWLEVEAAGALPTALEELVRSQAWRCRLRLPSRTLAQKRCLFQDYSTDDPEVTVGPDDLALVAFTSGSTGTPKGILGRHGPLSHFLPWQQETFGLRESDRFSLLSGLSHDPLQRDIFTPFWLGATLCIPDPEKMGSPGWLASWMRQQQVSIAHLTPAMMQLLTQGTPPPAAAEGQLTCLRYAFTLGDMLRRREVARLRRLAPGVTCVNFYGATETQRAVGYFPVPNTEEPGSDEEATQGRSRETIPLGRGVKDVQLLVLNASGQLAGVGETGEIYVRSPHLARGYLGDESLTRARFLPNPFTNLPGDRLYKTGDLGRYLPDGNVECLGRNDFQVKIRGFRIELGEIEAVLGQHPAVREVVVLAREDVPGNKRLVAYLMVTEGQSVSAGDLRGYLAQSLPEYMIPSAFVTLAALPLTPNGKVDRRGLPAPDSACLEADRTYVPPRDRVETRLARLWEEVLNTRPIGVKDNFFALGGHSLLAARLFAQIQKEFGQNLPLAVLFQGATIEHLAGILRRADQSATQSLVALHPIGSKRPFFCVHGIGGEVLCFADLARCLGPDQPFYGLQAQRQYGNPESFPSVEAMAKHYLQQIQTVQSEGPYCLGGFSAGGTVAYEMAQQLHAQGQQVALLAMLDHGAGNVRAPLTPGTPRWLVHFLRNLVYWLHDDLFQCTPGEVGRRLRLQVRGYLRRYGRNPAVEAEAANHHAGVLNRMFDLDRLPEPYRNFLEGHSRALRNYVPRKYPGRVTLLRARTRPLFRLHEEDMGWRKLAQGGVDIRVVPGSHKNILKEPYVRGLAQVVRACLNQAEVIQHQEGKGAPFSPSDAELAGALLHKPDAPARETVLPR